MSNYSDSAFDENNANTSWYKVFSLIPEKSKVLDVGCSSGNFGIELINRKKCIVDGIELDESDYIKAQKKLRQVFNLNIETDSLALVKDKYDIVYFGDVIEHLVNPVAALQRVKNLLAPKGKILFSIPNMTHIAVRLQLLKGDFEYTETGLLDKTHLHFYSLDEVYRVFREAGFEIDTIDFVEKDYPESLIDSWLDGLGLKANKNFYSEMKKPEAAAFQFVGTAVISKKKIPVHRQQFGPIDLFESYHTNTVRGLEKRNVSLEKENEELRKQRDHLQARWTMLKRNPPRFVLGTVKRKIRNKNK